VRAGRLERLLPWTCIAAAAVLFASQLMILFEFTPPGAEPLSERTGINQHGPAILITSGFAILCVIALWFMPQPSKSDRSTGSGGGAKALAIAVAAMGVLSLLFFLVIDLPNAGQVGTLEDARQSFIDAEAVPRAGFWLELLGALGLALSGGALATMTPEQLGTLRGDFFRRGKPKEKAKPKAPAKSKAPAKKSNQNAKPEPEPKATSKPRSTSKKASASRKPDPAEQES